MAFIMDRRRLALRPPQPFAPDEFLFGRFTREDVLARIERPPYREAYRRLMRVARASARADATSAAMGETQRAHFMRALAFSAWLTGSKAHRDRAIAILDIAGIGRWPPWCGAETLGDYALAYDFLRATGELPRAENQHFCERLGEKLAGGIAVNAQLPQNNWRLCALSNIGIMTLALWRQGTSWPVADWLEAVGDGLSRLLFGLVSPEGVYLEGPGYSRRSAVGFLPFAWAATRHCGVDLVNAEPVRRWMRWLAEALCPNGDNPPIDDTRREALHPWPLLCHLDYRDAPLMRWAADRQGHWDDLWDLHALLLYDDHVRPEPPAEPASRVLETSGMAVLRSDWSAQATYGLLAARPLPPLGPGQADSAHRHDDPTNFLIYANGEPLTTEAGYGQYSHPGRYTWFLQGEAHNLILVDGQGPPRCTYYRGDGSSPNVATANGRVRSLYASPELEIVAAEADYQQVGFTRLMAFVRKRYFVLLDIIDAAAPHTYEWVLHGMGRLKTLTAEEALWQTRRSRLAVRWIEPAGLVVSRHRGTYHGAGEFEQNDYIKAAVSGKRLAFLTVLLPGARGAARPEVRPLAVTSPGVGVSIIRADGAEHFAFSPWGDRIEVTAPNGRARELSGRWGVLMTRGRRTRAVGDGWE